MPEDRAAALRQRTDTWADVAYGKPYLELDRRQRDGLGRLMRIADSETASALQQERLELLDVVYDLPHDNECPVVCTCWKASLRARLRAGNEATS